MPDETSVDLAARRGRTEQKAGDDEESAQDEADRDVEDVLRQQLQLADPGQSPEHARNHRADSEPAPKPRASEREGGSRHHGEIEIEREIIGRFGRDDERRDEGADQTEPCERRPVQERSGERAERDQAEQEEGERLDR